jgi:hypothetical protein
MQHATFSMQHSMRRAACDVQHATCSMHRAACNIACNVQHATCSMRRSACNIACDVRCAACSVQHAAKRATCSGRRALHHCRPIGGACAGELRRIDAFIERHPCPPFEARFLNAFFTEVYGNAGYYCTVRYGSGTRFLRARCLLLRCTPVMQHTIGSMHRTPVTSYRLCRRFLRIHHVATKTSRRSADWATPESAQAMVPARFAVA